MLSRKFISNASDFDVNFQNYAIFDVSKFLSFLSISLLSFAVTHSLYLSFSPSLSLSLSLSFSYYPSLSIFIFIFFFLYNFFKKILIAPHSFYFFPSHFFLDLHTFLHFYNRRLFMSHFNLRSHFFVKMFCPNFFLLKTGH